MHRKPSFTLRLFYVMWQAVDYWLEQEENQGDDKIYKDMAFAQEWCRRYTAWRNNMK